MDRNSIVKSAQRHLRERKEHNLFGRISIFIKDPLPKYFDITKALKMIEQILPEFAVSEIESVFIGQFEELSSRDLHAMFKDGTIYLTNEQTSEQKMVEDVVHECAHSIEAIRAFDIYADDTIEKEFLGKRKRLLDIMEAHGYTVFESDFLSSEYSKKFDEFLYEDVGYPALTSLTMGLFVSPYAITSLREYFASGFEEYILGDITSFRKISPHLFTKLSEMNN
jgi:hypothetical protein